jgi:hypothetical protein
MECLKNWCDETCTPADFEARLITAEQSEDIGTALLADELLALWRAVPHAGAPFTDT